MNQTPKLVMCKYKFITISKVVLFLVILLSGCRETIVEDKSKLLAVDYRLFQQTPAWEVAKAVQDGNVDKIKEEIGKNKKLISFREPVWGQPLLKFAVMSENYESTKALLESGADPNMQDLDYGDSPLMEAVRIGGRGSYTDDGSYKDVGSDPRFLKLLLRYGGNPNDTSAKLRLTPLLYACRYGHIDYVKILIDAGAKVNGVNQRGTSPLAEAAIQHFPELVIYLIKNGADYKKVLYTTIPEKENKYITDAMRHWRFDLNSGEYKKKMWLVNFLKKNGMDYKKAKIPEEFYDDYSKDYLSKY